MRHSGRCLATGTALLGLVLTTACQQTPPRDPHRSGQVVSGPIDSGTWAGHGTAPIQPPASPAGPPLAAPPPAEKPVPPPIPDKPGTEEKLPRPRELSVSPPLREAQASPTPPVAATGLGHAGDYRWLVGRLEYVHVRDAWRIRFAAVDEGDRYGGTMTLVNTGPMTAYRNGQTVRVEGTVADPESREPSPAYRVRSIQPVSAP